MRRVVVTGLGMLSPLGNSPESTWQNLLLGKSGISDITHFDTSEYPTRFAGLVKDFDAQDYMARKDAKQMDLFIQYGVAAGVQAIKDSGLEVNEANAQRIGVAIGSGIGGLGLIEENHTKLLKNGPRKLSPFFVPSTIINMISGHLSIMFGMKGPNISIVTACTSGVHNIGHAARMIAYGDADAMVAGGAEKASTTMGMGGFGAARAMSTRNDAPQQASRPWDKDRDGFVLGAGAALAMKNAINDAKVDIAKIGYINAHGTSTPAGDIAETNAVKSVFGDLAYDVMVGSTKSMTGHLLGAAGAVEAIFSIQALVNNAVPPTINLDNPDEGCDLDYIAHTARDVNLDYVLCNSFGFGGTNGSLIFKKL